VARLGHADVEWLICFSIQLQKFERRMLDSGIGAAGDFSSHPVER